MAAKTAAERLREAGELIEEYVNHGAMDADDQFDRHFLGALERLPARLGRPLARVWRAVTLAAADYGRLAAGETLALRPRAFGSWTKDRDAARQLLRSRCAKAGEGEVVLLVEKPVEPGRRAIDVEALFRALGWDHPDVAAWGNYVAWEKEVILAQDGPLWTLAPSEVVAAHAARDPAACRPHEGELVWSTDGHEVFVKAVPDEQPHAADGRWRIVDADGAARDVEWNGRFNAWDETEPPAPQAGPAR